MGKDWIEIQIEIVRIVRRIRIAAGENDGEIFGGWEAGAASLSVWGIRLRVGWLRLVDGVMNPTTTILA